jgi:hypothetical protein
MIRRTAPVVGLLLLAPLIAEYLLGNVPATSLPALPFLVPLYGCAALLIREVARRTGRGWPAVLLLGAAFGLFEAGVVDQALFNPSYESWDFRSAGYLPWFGFGMYHLIVFVVGHAVWSIAVPIMLAETFVPARAQTHWLGPIGFAVNAAGLLLGFWIIFDDHQQTEHFMATPAQLIGAALGAALLAAAALRRSAGETGWVPGPRLLAGLSFLVAGGYCLAPENWTGVAVQAVALVGAGSAVGHWSRRPGWGDAHRLALAAGALLTYCWLCFVLFWLTHRTDPANLLGQGGLVLAAVVLLLLADRSLRRRVAQPAAPAAHLPAQGAPGTGAGGEETSV